MAGTPLLDPSLRVTAARPCGQMATVEPCCVNDAGSCVGWDPFSPFAALGVGGKVAGRARDVVGCWTANGVRGDTGALWDTLRTEVDLAMGDPGHSSDAAILLFELVDAALLAQLRELVQAGHERVIALALPGSPLAADEYWSVLKAGACDVMHCDPAPPASAIAERVRRWREVDELLESKLVRQNLAGDSPAWRRVLRQVIDVACFTDANALLVGETGTGKELVGRLIHTLDRRSGKRQLVVLDCTTISKELSYSELFGHERGAFTGAVGPREGAFALADGGSLFLDEVGDLPPALQPQLLRVIQERTFKRVGGSEWQSSKFRLVSATHRDLPADVASGRFRSDLYHRIATIIFRLPPLRARAEDILPLARRFLVELGVGGPAPEFQAPVARYLLQRDYPGNVRELRQLMQRIAGRHVGGGPITVGDIPEDERPAPAQTREPAWDREFELAIGRALSEGVGLKDISQRAAEAAIRIAVGEADGNLQRAARRLGVTDRALQLRRAQRGCN
jgi:DNA-binding NtrC family response regulator